MLLFCGAFAFAQNRVVSGTVTGSDGKPVSFASIKIRNTPTGVTADVNGSYSIKVKDGDVLEISGAGFETQRVTVRSSDNIVDVQLKSTVSLSEVVVTALGIRRQAKELGYSNSSEDGNNQEPRKVCETFIKFNNTTGVKLKITVYDGSAPDKNVLSVTKFIAANQMLKIAVPNDNSNYYYTAEEQNSDAPKVWRGNMNAEECVTITRTLKPQ